MKFTLKWLEEHLDTEASLDQIVAKLTMIGLEVDAVEDRAAALAPFTVAYVKEARPHPNADRLSVCIVDTGSQEVQVVCGAPNARTGMTGVFAAAGSYIPGTDTTLRPGVIRGEASNGMLVSEREMGLSDEHEGIIELPEDAVVGTPFAEVLGLDDPVIDVEITPNRGDCLGVRGIARDLAAAGLGTLKPFEIPIMPGTFESPLRWQRDLPGDKAEACPFVAGRLFRNVKNGPSPAWLQSRLRAIGLRPISALVDMTNYVTYDLGRPLHVFDADKIEGDLTMRMARSGEEIPALDGETYRLDEEMVVIADRNGPQGIGGVMGGEASGCTETTTNVFLEVALFEPVRVAATGRKLGILSDARYRFERGLDPQSAVWGPQVAARLVLDLCGGEASRVVSAGDLPVARRVIEHRPSRVDQLGGLKVPSEAQVRILVDLGFEVAGSGDRLRVTVPGWRNDVEGEACIVEEVLRIHGFDEIPTVMPTRDHALPQAALFGGVGEDLRLINPISSDLDVMRPSVLPGLAAAAGRNADRGLADVALFEIGPQYADATPDGQALVAAGLRAGNAAPRHWAVPARRPDAFDAKGDALAALEACGAPVDKLQVTTDAPAWYHPGHSGVLRLGPNVLANFGELHPRVLGGFELRGPTAAFEAFLDKVPLPKAKDGKLRPAFEPSPFHAVERDFAFVVDEDVPAEKVVRAAKGADKALVTKVELFDVYTGKGIEAGKKSLAIAVTLQPTKRTMTDAEIEAVAKKIVAQVEKATGGVLRG